MRYWLDTEFIEDGRTIDLLSIAIVGEDGSEFYAENLDADLSKASQWVQKNVIPRLFSQQPNKTVTSAWSRDGGAGGLMNHKAIGGEVLRFVDIEKNGEPEFWGYYADYDWVAFAQLYGTMANLPSGFPMYCRDIKQWCDMLGNPRLPERGRDEHHALTDARWNKAAWEFLRNIEALSAAAEKAWAEAKTYGK